MPFTLNPTHRGALSQSEEYSGYWISPNVSHKNGTLAPLYCVPHKGHYQGRGVRVYPGFMLWKRGFSIYARGIYRAVDHFSQNGIDLFSVAATSLMAEPRRIKCSQCSDLHGDKPFAFVNVINATCIYSSGCISEDHILD